MFTNTRVESDLVVEYTDPVEGFKGWLVIDSMTHRLAAGGLRVQQGLTCETVQRLAATMTLKMRIAGIRLMVPRAALTMTPQVRGNRRPCFVLCGLSNRICRNGTLWGRI
ncbi:hypothetical protein VU11_03985 [Desulfobulbus sp. US2]|nr:hypothetical protein [Desulfobulbus sp. US2]